MRTSRSLPFWVVPANGYTGIPSLINVSCDSASCRDGECLSVKRVDGDPDACCITIGVSQARWAWVEKESVINCVPLGECE